MAIFVWLRSADAGCHHRTYVSRRVASKVLMKYCHPGSPNPGIQLHSKEESIIGGRWLEGPWNPAWRPCGRQVSNPCCTDIRT